MIDIRRLAFIGGGNMAAALIGGLTKRGLPGERIAVADPSADQLQRLVRDYGVKRAADNAERGGGRRGRRPGGQAAADARGGAGPGPHLAASKPLVISVAAGIPHAALARWFGPQIAVVRTMPNRPALNGFGATGLYAPASVGAANRALAESIMAAVSATVWVEHESQMDTVTALSGSGPAYFFLFMEALEAAAHERGLPNDIAHKLTLETAFGAAQMARQSSESLACIARASDLQGRHHRRGARGARCRRSSCHRRTRRGGSRSPFGRARRGVRNAVGCPEPGSSGFLAGFRSWKRSDLSSTPCSGC